MEKTNIREYNTKINGEEIVIKISVEKDKIYITKPNRFIVSVKKRENTSYASKQEVLRNIGSEQFYLSNRNASNPKKVSACIDRAIEKIAWEFFTVITIPDYCGKYNLTEIEVGENV